MHVHAAAMVMRVDGTGRPLPRRQIDRPQTEPHEHQRDTELEEIGEPRGHFRA